MKCVIKITHVSAGFSLIHPRQKKHTVNPDVGTFFKITNSKRFSHHSLTPKKHIVNPDVEDSAASGFISASHHGGSDLLEWKPAETLMWSRRTSYCRCFPFLTLGVPTNRHCLHHSIMKRIAPAYFHRRWSASAGLWSYRKRIYLMRSFTEDEDKAGEVTQKFF